MLSLQNFNIKMQIHSGTTTLASTYTFLQTITTNQSNYLNESVRYVFELSWIQRVCPVCCACDNQAIPVRKTHSETFLGFQKCGRDEYCQL